VEKALEALRQGKEALPPAEATLAEHDEELKNVRNDVFTLEQKKQKEAALQAEKDRQHEKELDKMMELAENNLDNEESRESNSNLARDLETMKKPVLEENASSVTSLAQAKEQAKMIQSKEKDDLLRATSSGDETAIDKFKVDDNAANAQQKYVERLQERMKTEDVDRMLVAKSDKAMHGVMVDREAYQESLSEVRQALQAVIQTGSKTALDRYLRLRSKLDDEKTVLEKADHMSDQAAVDQARLAENQQAAAFENEQDPNPRVAALVWKKLVEEQSELHDAAKAATQKAMVNLAKSGLGADTLKHLQKKERDARLNFLKFSTTLAEKRIQATEKEARRILNVEARAVITMRKDKALYATLEEKQDAADALTSQASSKVASNEEKLKLSRQNLRMMRIQLRDSITRRHDLQDKRNRAYDNYRAERESLGYAKEDTENTIASLKEEEHVRSVARNKKLKTIKRKIYDAENTLEEMKDAQRTHENAMNQHLKAIDSNLDPAERLKQEEEYEMNSLEAKMSKLKKEISGAAIEKKKMDLVKVQNDEADAEDHRVSTNEDAAQARDDVKAKTTDRIEEIKLNIQEKTNRRLHRIRATTDAKLSKLEGKLSGAIGGTRQRLLAQVAELNAHKNKFVSQLRARMKRRLERRVERVKRKGLMKEKSVVATVMAKADAWSKKKLLKATLSNANSALSKVEKYRKRIIDHEFGLLRIIRDQIIKKESKKETHLLKVLNKADNIASKHDAQRELEIARAATAAKIKKATKESKDRADTKIAKESIKLLKEAKDAAAYREKILLERSKRDIKRQLEYNKREVKRRFNEADADQEEMKKLTTDVMQKITARITTMKNKVRMEGLQKIEDYETETTEKNDKRIKEIIKDQDLVPKAMTMAKNDTNAPTEFDDSEGGNPWAGKATLGNKLSDLQKKYEKDLESFKAHTEAGIETAIKKKSIDIKEEEMDSLSISKGTAKKRNQALRILKRSTDRTLRRNERRLRRAERKAISTDDPADKLKIEKVSEANDSAKAAAAEVLRSAARMHKERKSKEHRRNVAITIKQAKRAERSATAELNKAAISGSKSRMALGEKRLMHAKELGAKAVEARLDQVHAHEMHEYGEALEAGGSPTGGGKVESAVDIQLNRLTKLIKAAKESNSPADYKLATYFMRRTKRYVKTAKEKEQLSNVEKLKESTDALKFKLSKVEAKFLSAEDVTSMARAQVVKAEEAQRHADLNVEHSKRALSIAESLSRVAKLNLEMQGRQVDRDRKWVMKLRSTVGDNVDKLEKAKTAAKEAEAEHKMAQDGREGMDPVQKLRKLKETAAFMKQEESRRIEDSVAFFKKLAGETPGMSTKQQLKTVVSKIKKHSADVMLKTNIEISNLEILVQHQGKVKASAGAAGLLKKRMFNDAERAAMKKEQRIAAKKIREVAAIRKKLVDSQEAIDKAQKASDEALVAMQEDYTKKMKKFKLQLMNASAVTTTNTSIGGNQTPTNASTVNGTSAVNVNGASTGIKTQMKTVLTQLKDKMAKEKQDAEMIMSELQQARTLAEKEMKRVNEEAKKKKAEAEAKLAADKKAAEEAAEKQAMAAVEDADESNALDSEQSKNEEAKQEEVEVAKEDKSAAGLLQKMWALRDEIEDVLEFHIEQSTKKATSAAVLEKQEELEDKQKDKEEKQQAEKANMEADAAIDGAKDEGRLASKIKNGAASLQADDKQEYSKLAVGYKPPEAAPSAAFSTSQEFDYGEAPNDAV